MSTTPKAVFLSYASQDAEAARRICEALRATGVEVWFDQTGLRGGDAWDQKIRRQIRECALFVPIVSASTQARREGYFRLEWRLADQRTHLMGKSGAFIVPVCIDDTRDQEADVPDSFLAVQWTRLPPDTSPSAFAEQVKLLLGAGGVQITPAPFVLPEKPRAGTEQAGTLHSTGERKRSRGRGVGLVVGAVIGVLAIVTLAVWQPWKKSELQGDSRFAPSAAAKPAINPVATKSIAVLAFENLSGDKENEYFSDGISEELLNVLAKTPGLRVAARTSAFYFKGRNTPIQEIAQKLDVAYVVEGSVRKAGTQVRITARLLNAADGKQVWADDFREELKDVFALQDKIAGVIAQNLHLKLGGTPRSRPVDPVAHQLALQGRHFWMLRTDEGFAQAETAYAKALKIDPAFAPAHAGLAADYVVRAVFRMSEGFNDFEADLVRARESAREALNHEPMLVDAHTVLGFEAALSGRFSESEEHFQRAFAINPSDVFSRHWHSHLLARQGRLDQALAENAQAVRLDPLAYIISFTYAYQLALAQRFPEALEMIERSLIHRPDFIAGRGTQAFCLAALGRLDEAVRIARAIRRDSHLGQRGHGDASAVSVLVRAGLVAEAVDYATELLATWPADNTKRHYLLAALGRFDEALRVEDDRPRILFQDLWCFWDPGWDKVRNDPRFDRMLIKMKAAGEYPVARETLARMLAEKQRTAGESRKKEDRSQKSVPGKEASK